METFHRTLDLVPAAPGWEILYLPTPDPDDLVRGPVIGWMATAGPGGDRTYMAATISRLGSGLVERVDDSLHGDEVWKVVPAGEPVDESALEYELNDRVTSVKGLIEEKLTESGGRVDQMETGWDCHGIEFGDRVIQQMIDEGTLTRETDPEARGGPCFLVATARKQEREGTGAN